MKLGERLRRFRYWHEVGLLLLLLMLLGIASLAKPDFLRMRGQLLLSRHLWEFAILALAMTPIIITGGIDLSVGSAMGLCAVAFGICFNQSQDVTTSCCVAMLVGVSAGALNGLLVAKIRVHPLIVTLSTYAAFRGIAEGLSQGRSYSQFGEAFSTLARGMWFGVPIPAYLFALLAIVVAVFLSATPTGRFIYAIGHNENAARFSGVPVARIKFWLYTFSGAMAGLATVIYVSRFDTAKADAGTGFELDVITAVVVGGTSIFGGRGNIGGTVLGLLLIHETRQFVSRQWRTDELKSIVIGVLLIVSVLVYRVLSKRDQDS